MVFLSIVSQIFATNLPDVDYCFFEVVRQKIVGNLRKYLLKLFSINPPQKLIFASTLQIHVLEFSENSVHFKYHYV